MATAMDATPTFTIGAEDKLNMSLGTFLVCNFWFLTCLLVSDAISKQSRRGRGRGGRMVRISWWFHNRNCYAHFRVPKNLPWETTKPQTSETMLWWEELHAAHQPTDKETYKEWEESQHLIITITTPTMVVLESDLLSSFVQVVLEEDVEAAFLDALQQRLQPPHPQEEEEAWAVGLNNSDREESTQARRSHNKEPKKWTPPTIITITPEQTLPSKYPISTYHPLHYVNGFSRCLVFKLVWVPHITCRTKFLTCFVFLSFLFSPAGGQQVGFRARVRAATTKRQNQQQQQDASARVSRNLKLRGLGQRTATKQVSA